MNKKFFQIIVALMLLTVLGFMVAQIFWIKKSYAVAEQDFESKINNALNDVVDHLKSKDIFLLIDGKNNGNNSAISHVSAGQVILDDTTSWMTEKRVMKTMAKGDSENVSMMVVNSTIDNGVEVITHFDTIVNDEIETTITFSDDNHLQIVNDENTSIRNMVQEIIIQYSSDDDPLQTRLNNVDLDSLLKEKLNNRGIYDSFSYGVKTESGDSLLTNFSNIDNLNQEQKVYAVNLFENDVFNLDHQLLVLFENSNSFIFRQLKWMLLSLFILTLMMIFTFGYTLKVIWKQKKIDQMKNDFINNMTHEFKTPIATIGLALDALGHKKNIVNSEKTEYFHTLIREENNRINHQVERVLNITRFSKGNFPLLKRNINLKSSIQKAIDLLVLQIESSRTTINFISCDDTLSLNADSDLLEKLWINLIDNSIKYSDKNPEIEITCQQKNDVIVVVIKDNGVGMNAETKERVFENFYREQNGDIHTIKGFGLGMSYVKKIIDLHQGTIEIASEQGKGTLVRVLFPKR